MSSEGEHEVPPAVDLGQQVDEFRADYEALKQEIGKVIVGQKDVVEGILTALFGGGHVLLEGAPGLGKTLLARTLADVLDLEFRRIQFTPGEGRRDDSSGKNKDGIPSRTHNN